MITIKNMPFYELSRNQYIESLTHIQSMDYENEEKKETSLYDTLSDDEKKDIIEIDGRKYIRKIYEARKGVF